MSAGVRVQEIEIDLIISDRIFVAFCVRNDTTFFTFAQCFSFTFFPQLSLSFDSITIACTTIAHMHVCICVSVAYVYHSVSGYMCVRDRIFRERNRMMMTITYNIKSILQNGKRVVCTISFIELTLIFLAILFDLFDQN